MRPLKISPAVVTIDSLPDEILRRILSLVTTKEAVATGILSKRWIHLWRSVSTIDFTGIRVDNIKSICLLNEFIDSVLASRDAAAGGSNFINTFLFDIYYRDADHARYSSFPYILKWLNLVLQHRLQHLRLRLDLRTPRWVNIDHFLPTLPISIFTCTTLVSLDLCWFRVDLDVRFLRIYERLIYTSIMRKFLVVL
ncbi:F-box/LRR-repeat protein [Trifolium medium]|uniref:F-box/LRR-repeat protein n=1 Tax=Trifolium medium TaxID=97028 RepID=A0A392MWA5_9FABA|nr:F-box/LRR-repeat protein [Trifolium medium]